MHRLLRSFVLVTTVVVAGNLSHGRLSFMTKMDNVLDLLSNEYSVEANESPFFPLCIIKYSCLYRQSMKRDISEINILWWVYSENQFIVGESVQS